MTHSLSDAIAMQVADESLLSRRLLLKLFSPQCKGNGTTSTRADVAVMSNLLKNWLKSVVFGKKPERKPHRDPLPGLTVPKAMPRAPIPSPKSIEPKQFETVDKAYARFKASESSKKSRLKAPGSTDWVNRLRE